MEKLPSFKIDHTRLKPGLYLSQSMVENDKEHVIETFDIRLITPNSGTFMTQEASHTIEHLGATYLKTISAELNKGIAKPIYFGPMGCQTGFYMILEMPINWKAFYIYLPQAIVTRMFEYIVDAVSIPGATEKECGNYKLHNLQGAQILAIDYLKTLNENSPRDRILSNYSYNLV